MYPIQFNSNKNNDDDGYKIEISDHYPVMKSSKFDIDKNMAQVVVAASSTAKKRTNNSVVVKSNLAINDGPPVNYRLIHHLYVHYKSTTIQCQSLWSSIAHDYNLVLFTNYTAKEIENFWRRMPLMEKRKIDLQHYENFDDSNDENIKPSSSSPQPEKKAKKVAKKSKKPPSATTTVTNNGGNKKRKNSKAQPVKVDKSCQINNDDDDNNNGSSIVRQQTELNELAKEEYRLKIEILKIRLEYMKQQYQRMFSNSNIQ